MSNKIKIVIATSVLLNVLLTGIILGHVLSKLTHRPPGGVDNDHVVSQLSAEKRKVFLDTMQQVSIENRKIRKHIREGRERALAALSAREFSESDYMAETVRLDELRMRISHNTTAATVALAAGFSQEERKVLAAYIRHLPMQQRNGPHASGQGKCMSLSPPPPSPGNVGE
ncbi:MAG: periplasmic heavy metal sensor [Candidatus Magnetobacterium sp. LHC-1]